MGAPGRSGDIGGDRADGHQPVASRMDCDASDLSVAARDLPPSIVHRVGPDRRIFLSPPPHVCLNSTARVRTGYSGRRGGLVPPRSGVASVTGPTTDGISVASSAARSGRAWPRADAWPSAVPECSAARRVVGPKGPRRRFMSLLTWDPNVGRCACPANAGEGERWVLTSPTPCRNPDETGGDPRWMALRCNPVSAPEGCRSELSDPG